MNEIMEELETANVRSISNKETVKEKRRNQNVKYTLHKEKITI
jgi:hypothetical protein